MRSSFYLWIGTCSGTDQCCGKSERNRAEDSLHSHSPASLSLSRVLLPLRVFVTFYLLRLQFCGHAPAPIPTYTQASLTG